MPNSQEEIEKFEQALYNCILEDWDDKSKASVIWYRRQEAIDNGVNPNAIDYKIGEYYWGIINEMKYKGEISEFNNKFIVIPMKVASVDNFKDSSPCFASSTPILTPRGEVLIQDIAVGDSVLAFDGFNELFTSKFFNLQRKTTDTRVELSVGDKTIKATPNHRMFTPSGDFATLNDLIQNAQNNILQLVDSAGKIVDVVFKIINLETPENTYNFEVETLHTYVAGGLRVHNDCIFLLSNEITMTATERNKYYLDLNNALKDAKENGYKVTGFKADGTFNDTEYSLFANSGLADKGFGFVKTVNSGGQTQHFVNKNAVKNLSNTNEEITYNGTEKTINGKNYALLSDTAEVVIDGVTYTAGAINEAYEYAIEGLSQFVGDYKSNINMMNGALSTALTQTFADLGALVASGQSIDGTKVLQKFAGYAGIALVTQCLSQTDIAKNLSAELDLKLGDGYGEAITLALINFGVTAIKPSYRATTRYPVTPSNDNRPKFLLLSVA